MSEAVTLAQRSLDVVSVGGGPAGLTYAVLAKRRFPSHRITVLERNPSDASFGFGLVFSQRSLDDLQRGDAELHARIAAARVSWESIEIRHRGERVRCDGHGFCAIGRRELLAILRERAAELGVEQRFQVEVSATMLPDADLVLAADGVNSAIREARAEVFAPHVKPGTARYIWFGTTQRFDALTFIFAESEHGWWGAHAYPFDEHTSTFIVETDEQTWRRAGLQRTEELPPGCSDMASLELCASLFAEHLDGHGLLDNNSRWLTFRTVSNAVWHDGNVVLLGDAAHTAHFSIGSGTKLAMEDAGALVDAIAEAHTLEQALMSYTALRRPEVSYVQSEARASQIWWERFTHVADRPTAELVFHFLTRAPAVTRARLRGRDRRLLERIEQEFASASSLAHAADPLATPFAIGSYSLRSRLIALGGLSLAQGPAGIDRAAAPANGDLAAAIVLLSVGEAVANTVGSLPLPDPARDPTAALRGLMLAASAGQPLPALVRTAQLAMIAGYDMLACSLSLAALEDRKLRAALSSAFDAWPADRPLLVTLLPRSEDELPAATLGALRALAAARQLLVAVAKPARTGRLLSDRGVATQIVLLDALRYALDVPIVAADVRSHDEAASFLLAGRADLCLGRPLPGSSRWAPCWD